MLVLGDGRVISTAGDSTAVEPDSVQSSLEALDERMARVQALVQATRRPSRVERMSYGTRNTFTLLMRVEELNKQIESRDG